MERYKNWRDMEGWRGKESVEGGREGRGEGEREGEGGWEGEGGEGRRERGRSGGFLLWEMVGGELGV